MSPVVFFLSLGGVVALNIVLTAYLLAWVVKLRRRFTVTLGDLNSTDTLAVTLADYFNKLGITASKLEQITSSQQRLSQIATDALQKQAIVRFNPFSDTGSDQSFVLAMLNHHDSGFLLTSIHSREGTRIYLKPIEYGSSEYSLSTEENNALNKAKKNGKKS